MSELDANGQVTPQNTDGQQVEPTNNTPEKLSFTQAEFDEIIKSRLKTERNNYKDYGDLKKKSLEYEALKHEHEELKSKVTAMADLEKLIESQYNSEVEGLNDMQKALIPSDYSLTKKMEFVKNLKSAMTPNTKSDPNSAQQVVVNIPGSVLNKPTNDKIELPGGFKTVEEYAWKDPKGYMKWANSQS